MYKFFPGSRPLLRYNFNFKHFYTNFGQITAPTQFPKALQFWEEQAKEIAQPTGLNWRILY